MLQAAIIFFILGLVAMLFGAFGIAGVSSELGEMLLAIFFIFALMSLKKKRADSFFKPHG